MSASSLAHLTPDELPTPLIPMLVIGRDVPEQLFAGSRPPDLSTGRRTFAMHHAGVAKPQGGLWTSSLVGEDQSAWTAYQEGRDIDESQRWRVTPSPDALLLRIARMVDVEVLAGVYPPLPFLGLPASVFDSAVVTEAFEPRLNFLPLLDLVDGVWLDPGDEALWWWSRRNLWDVESICWSRPRFSAVADARA